MGETPRTENSAASAANKVIRALVDGAVGISKGILVTHLPVLKFPVLSQLTDYALKKFGDVFYKAIAEYSTFAIIDFQTEEQKKDFLEGVELLKAADKTGDPYVIEEARKQFKERMGRLIRWDGSADIM